MNQEIEIEGYIMPRRTSIIPKAPLGRIILRAGAKRVSADALDSFADVLIEIAESISSQAVKIAQHSGRKTVQAGDVKLAARQ